jgi:hypothetical protein
MHSDPGSKQCLVWARQLSSSTKAAVATAPWERPERIRTAVRSDRVRIFTGLLGRHVAGCTDDSFL